MRARTTTAPQTPTPTTTSLKTTRRGRVDQTRGRVPPNLPATSKRRARGHRPPPPSAATTKATRTVAVAAAAVTAKKRRRTRARKRRGRQTRRAAIKMARRRTRGRRAIRGGRRRTTKVAWGTVVTMCTAILVGHPRVHVVRIYVFKFIESVLGYKLGEGKHA